MSRDIRGVRVTPTGSIPTRFTVNHRREDDMFADIAFDGTRYLVAYNDSRARLARVFYTLVEPEGTVLNDSGMLVAGQESLAIHENPSVASGHDSYLIAWLTSGSRGNVVLGLRIGTDGRQLDSLPLAFSPDSLLIEWVVAASDGTDFLLAWTSHAAGGPGSDLFYRRFPSSGGMLDSLPVLAAHSAEYLCEPALAFLHDRYLLAWTEVSAENRDIRACRILRDGTILDPTGFDIATGPGTQRQPDIASDSTRFFVLWSDNARADFDIMATFVDTAGNVGVTQASKVEVRAAYAGPTIVRGMFLLPHSLSPSLRLSLLDLSGRPVMSLRPGPNDVSHLSPGVYFLRPASGVERGASSVTKILVTR